MYVSVYEIIILQKYEKKYTNKSYWFFTEPKYFGGPLCDNQFYGNCTIIVQYVYIKLHSIVGMKLHSIVYMTLHSIVGMKIRSIVYMTLRIIVGMKIHSIVYMTLRSIVGMKLYSNMGMRLRVIVDMLLLNFFLSRYCIALLTRDYIIFWAWYNT